MFARPTAPPGGEPDQDRHLVSRIVAPGAEWSDPLGGMSQDAGDSLATWPDIRYASEWSIAGELEITAANGTTVTPFRLYAAYNRYISIHSQNWTGGQASVRVYDAEGTIPEVSVSAARNKVLKFAATRASDGTVSLYVDGTLVDTMTVANAVAGYPLWQGTLMVTNADVKWHFLAIANTTWPDAAAVSANPSGML